MHGVVCIDDFESNTSLPAARNWDAEYRKQVKCTLQILVLLCRPRDFSIVPQSYLTVDVLEEFGFPIAANSITKSSSFAVSPRDV